MTDYRTLILLVAVLAVVGTTTGTTGFSGVTADRGVEIAVADDDAAYLGVEQTLAETTSDTTNLTVTVTNRFPAGTTLETVTVETTADGRVRTLDALGVGESDSVTFDNVSCASEVAVRATGSAVDVSLSRDVRC